MLAQTLQPRVCASTHSRRQTLLGPRPAKKPRWPCQSQGLRRCHRIAVASEQTDTSFVEKLRHITLDGWGLELLLQRATGGATDRPPLLFVHGSYHAAWCWAEHFMPFFADLGFTVYAVSLRAQGDSDCISQDKGAAIQVAGTLDSHATDLADLISNIPQPPVVLAHSFGGLILQRYVQLMSPGPGQPGLPPLAGCAFLASVPPSGNKDMVGRFLFRDPIQAFKITWGFVAKSFAKDIVACRELFFSPDIPEPELIKYQAQLAGCSPVRLIDLSDVNKQVPLPPPPSYAPPAFVLGGEDDKVVDVEAIKELAKAWNVTPIIMPQLAHDVMLDTRWRLVADKLSTWLSSLPRSS